MSHHAPSPNGHGHAPAPHGLAHGDHHSGGHGAHADHSHGHGHHGGMPKWWKITIFLVVVTMAAYGLASGKINESVHYAAGSIEAKRDVVGNWLVVLFGWPAMLTFIWWGFIKKADH